MSVLQKIAYFQKRRDEIPNQELAKSLAQKKDRAGIREIAENLWHKNAQVQADCIKVLYEIAYQEPDLVAAYVGDFLKLLESKNNRLIWGGMIALSTIAPHRPEEIFQKRETIQGAMARGSVITLDNGVKTLALVAASSDARCRNLFPYLLGHLRTCRPKDVPQHSEKTLPAVNARNKKSFVEVLQGRLRELTPAQARRVKRVLKEVQGGAAQGRNHLLGVHFAMDMMQSYAAPATPV